MIAPEKLAAFVLVSGLTSLIPGPSMLFVLGEAVWRGARSGVVALAGVQMGYLLWYVLAALGLGALAAQVPVAFTFLAIGGALYLAWLGVQALRHAGEAVRESSALTVKRSAHPLRDGVVVAISNPKSLIYITALLPPFVDPRSAIVPQLVVLGTIAISLDVTFGLIYIAAATVCPAPCPDRRRGAGWTAAWGSSLSRSRLGLSQNSLYAGAEQRRSSCNSVA